MTYATITVKRDVMGRVFFLGGIHIRPTDDAIEGNIRYPPFYCDKQTLDGLLNAFGTVRDGDFVRTTDFRVEVSTATTTDPDLKADIEV